MHRVMSHKEGLYRDIRHGANEEKLLRQRYDHFFTAAVEVEELVQIEKMTTF